MPDEEAVTRSPNVASRIRRRARDLLAFFVGERWLLGLVLFGLIAALYHFDHPPDTFHEWRYTLTLMNAASYGQGAGWLTPEVSWYGAIPQPAVEEFPLYQIIAYLLSQVLSDLLLSARITSWICMAASIFVFDRICALRGHPRRRTATALFALSPLVIFQGNVPQPESLMLLATLGATYCALRALSGGWRWVAGASLLLAVAATIKPTALVILFFPLAYMAWTSRKRLPVAAILAVGGIAVVTWSTFAQAVDTVSVPDYYATITAPSWLFGPLADRLDPMLYRTIAERLALVLLPPLLVGLILSRSSIKTGDRFWWFWLLGSLVAVEVFTDLNLYHFYYQLPFIPALAALAAYGAPAWPRRAVWRFGAAGLVIVATVISLADLYTEYPINVDAGQALANAIGPADRPVVVLSASKPYYWPAVLYYSGHGGWVLPPTVSSQTIDQLLGPAPCEIVMLFDGQTPNVLPAGWQEVSRTNEYVLGFRQLHLVNGQDVHGC
jgi:Dolichyl-phosphate-mannose-protein mannosyltransferase